MPWRRLPHVFLILFLAGTVTAKEDAVETRMRADVAFLASDALEGRGVETEGLNVAADYIARKFGEAGLKPAGSKDWFQPFSIHGASALEKPATLILHGPLGQSIALEQGTDFQVMGLSGNGNVKAPVVFAGYGITAKEIGYDDYANLDVAGKVVVVLRKTPRYDNADAPFDGPRQEEHATFERKQALAEINKAAAVIVVNDQSEVAGGDKLTKFENLSLLGSSIPGLHAKRDLFDAILRSSLGTSLREIEQGTSRDLKSRAAPLQGWTATVHTAVKRKTIAVKNVVGVLEGSGPLAKETVVIGGHYDHLGYGGRGSRAKNPKDREIHNGADDNASGTSAVIELARRFAAIKGRQGRRLVFIAFSAEESGLLGSQHYCNKQPLFPLEETVAMVNLDMVGRLRIDPKSGQERLLVEGTGTAKGFEQLVDKLNPGFAYTKRPGSPPYSDNDSFYRKQVPILFFWTDSHEDYHRPGDDTEKINVPGMRKITDLTEKVVRHLATDPARPEYVKVASKMTMSAGKGPRLGIMPNYDESQEGVLVGGLSDDGPAAKAGLKVGDLIVEIAGKPVSNVSTYMVIMAQQRPGQALDVTVSRGKQRVKIKVMLP
jgi:hypothetical protein